MREYPNAGTLSGVKIFCHHRAFASRRSGSSSRRCSRAAKSGAALTGGRFFRARLIRSEGSSLCSILSFVIESALQQLLKAEPSPVQARLHRTHRGVRDLADLLIAHLLDIPQDHHLPVLRRKETKTILVEPRLQPPPRLSVGGIRVVRRNPPDGQAERSLQ